MNSGRNHGAEHRRADREAKAERVDGGLLRQVNVTANGAAADAAKEHHEANGGGALGGVDDVDRGPGADDGGLGAVAGGGEEDGKVADAA